MKEKILITGAGGFVGSNIVEALSADYTFVFIKRNSESNAYTWKEIPKAFADNEISSVIHLAGIAHDLKGDANAEDYYKINTGLTKELFDAFLTSSATQFFYFSSIKAVTDNPDSIITETTISDPKTHYGKSKLLAEEYLSAKPTSKKVYTLRPCMIHGPKNKGNLNVLFTLIKKGIPYPFAGFKNKRSLLFVGNLNFLLRRMLVVKPESGIYNLCDDQTLSTVEMISIMSSAVNRKPWFMYVPTRLIKLLSQLGNHIKFIPLDSDKLNKLTGDFIMDNTKIKLALDVDCLPYSIEDGLKATSHYFNQTSNEY